MSKDALDSIFKVPYYNNLETATEFLKTSEGKFVEVFVSAIHDTTHKQIFYFVREVVNKIFEWRHSFLSINEYVMLLQNCASLFDHLDRRIERLILCENLKKIPLDKQSFIFLVLPKATQAVFKPSKELYDAVCVNEIDEKSLFEMPEVCTCDLAKWYIFCLFVWVIKKNSTQKKQEVGTCFAWFAFIERFYPHSILDQIDMHFFKKFHKWPEDVRIRHFEFISLSTGENVELCTHFEFDEFEFDDTTIRLTKRGGANIIIDSSTKLSKSFYKLKSDNKAQNKEFLWSLTHSIFESRINNFWVDHNGINNMFQLIVQGLASDGPFGDFLLRANNLYDPRLLIEIEKFL